MKKKPTKPANFPLNFAPGLRPRLEKLRGHKTLTGLINDVLTAYADKQEALRDIKQNTHKSLFTVINRRAKAGDDLVKSAHKLLVRKNPKAKRK